MDHAGGVFQSLIDKLLLLSIFPGDWEDGFFQNGCQFLCVVCQLSTELTIRIIDVLSNTFSSLVVS